jgi:hypothetical protein
MPLRLARATPVPAAAAADGPASPNDNVCAARFNPWANIASQNIARSTKQVRPRVRLEHLAT